MFQVLLVVLLAASRSARLTPPTSGTGTIDTVVVDRLVRQRPNRVPFLKERTLSRGDTLARVIGRLERAGFSRITQASVAEVCGAVDGSRNRLSIKVHDDAGWQTLVIPDGCSPSSVILNAQLSGLRTLAWDVLAHHA